VMPVAFFSGLAILVPWEWLIVVFGALLLTGLVIIARALRLAGKPRMLSALILLIPIPLAGSVFMPGALAVLALGLVIGTSLFLSAADAIEHGPRTAAPRRRRAIAGAAGAVLLLTVTAVGLVDTFVVQPLAITDDAYDLDDIYGMIGADQAAATAVMPVIWAVGGVVIAVCFALVPVLARGRLAAWSGTGRIIALAVAAAGVGLIALPWAGFGLGMTISDTVPPMAGGISPLTVALLIVGFAFVVGVIVATVPPSRTRPMAPAPAVV